MSKEPDILPEDRDQFERDQFDQSLEPAFRKAIRITILVSVVIIAIVIAIIINV